MNTLYIKPCKFFYSIDIFLKFSIQPDRHSRSLLGYQKVEIFVVYQQQLYPTVDTSRVLPVY